MKTRPFWHKSAFLIHYICHFVRFGQVKCTVTLTELHHVEKSLITGYPRIIVISLCCQSELDNINSQRGPDMGPSMFHFWANRYNIGTQLWRCYATTSCSCLQLNKE